MLMNLPTLPLDNTTRLMFYCGWFLVLYATINLNRTVDTLQYYGYQIDSIRMNSKIDSAKLADYDSVNRPLNLIDEKRENIIDRHRASLRALKNIAYKIERTDTDKTQGIIFTIVGGILVLLTNSKINRKEKMQDDMATLQYNILLLEYENKLTPPKKEPRYKSR